jgi:hypothetical protein
MPIRKLSKIVYVEKICSVVQQIMLLQTDLTVLTYMMMMMIMIIIVIIIIELILNHKLYNRLELQNLIKMTAFISYFLCLQGAVAFKKVHILYTCL